MAVSLTVGDSGSTAGQARLWGRSQRLSVVADSIIVQWGRDILTLCSAIENRILQRGKFVSAKQFAMGVPSTQASNAIIYLTYGAFLYACILCDFPEPLVVQLRQLIQCHNQRYRALHCLVLSTSVQIRIFVEQSDTEGSDIPPTIRVTI